MYLFTKKEYITTHKYRTVINSSRLVKRIWSLLYLNSVVIVWASKSIVKSSKPTA